MSQIAPTLGTATIIAGGTVATRRGPAMLLALPPMRWLGGALSYSLHR